MIGNINDQIRYEAQGQVSGTIFEVEVPRPAIRLVLGA